MDRGLVTAIPLEKYSSLHEFSLSGYLGKELPWPRHFFVQHRFNRHTPLVKNKRAHFIFDTVDSDKEPGPDVSFRIENLNRWRLDISPYPTFSNYLNSLIRWHRCNYNKSFKAFNDGQAVVKVIETDWSEYVDEVYMLYDNVAKKYGERLYDLKFFQKVAKKSDYKLIGAWKENRMIGHFVLQEELPTLHSICCGFDYNLSKTLCVYSWLHYELIRYAIEKGIYHDIDVGLTADTSKRTIGFESIKSRMDIYAQGTAAHLFLKFLSKFMKARITPESQLKFSLRGFNP